MIYLSCSFGKLGETGADNWSFYLSSYLRAEISLDYFFLTSLRPIASLWRLTIALSWLANLVTRQWVETTFAKPSAPSSSMHWTPRAALGACRDRTFSSSQTPCRPQDSSATSTCRSTTMAIIPPAMLTQTTCQNPIWNKAQEVTIIMEGLSGMLGVKKAINDANLHMIFLNASMKYIAFLLIEKLFFFLWFIHANC